MAVYGLDERLWFPDPYEGEPDGLVAVYGDLSPERLLLAYSNGYFPWYSYRATAGAPFWYCPLDRFVIFPDEIHVSHSMRQMLRSDAYEVTFNEDFPAVIQNCSTAQERNVDFGAWLGPDMIDAYTRLYRLGYASSVEVWERDGHRLVGGIRAVRADFRQDAIDAPYNHTMRVFYAESDFEVFETALEGLNDSLPTNPHTQYFKTRVERIRSARAMAQQQQQPGQEIIIK